MRPGCGARRMGIAMATDPVASELREELARRLCDAFNGEADRIRAEEKETGVPCFRTYKDDPLLLWRQAADEAIRHMEWARDGRELAAWLHEEDDRPPLTLPPPDWTP